MNRRKASIWFIVVFIVLLVFLGFAAENGVRAAFVLTGLVAVFSCALMYSIEQITRGNH